MNDFDRLLANEYLDWYMKDELLDETELYPFAEDEKGVSFLVNFSVVNFRCDSFPAVRRAACGLTFCINMLSRPRRTPFGVN